MSRRPARRCHGPLPSGPLRGPDRTCRPPGQACRGGIWGRAPPHPPPPVRCNATLVAGEPGSGGGEAERWAADGFTTFKLKLGDRRRRRARCGPCGRRSGRGRGSGSTPTAPGAVETAKRTLAALEPFDIELAEQPVATLEEAAELAASTVDPDRRRRERRDAAPTPNAPSRCGACDADRDQARRRSAVRAGDRIAARPPRLPLERPRRPGRDRRRRARRPDAAARRATADDGLAHGLATQRLFAATIAAVECELRGDLLHPPDGPGLGVEIDEAALDAHRL